MTLPGTVPEADDDHGFNHDAIRSAEHEMNPPDDSVPVSSEYVTYHPPTWETARDHEQGTATVRSTEGKRVDLPHGGTMTFEKEITVRTAADDPDTLVAVSDIELQLDRPTETVTSKVHCRFARDDVHMRTTVLRDGKQIFDRSWDT